MLIVTNISTIFSQKKKRQSAIKNFAGTIPTCVGSQSKNEPKKFKTPKQI
jgi:hypothetical protein